jgi:hypothetical protein
MTLWGALLDILDATWWALHWRFNVTMLCAVGLAFFVNVAQGEPSRPLAIGILVAGFVVGIVWEAWDLYDWSGHWRLYVSFLTAGGLGWLFYQPYRGQETGGAVAAIVACAVACLVVAAGFVWDSRR